MITRNAWRLLGVGADPARGAFHPVTVNIVSAWLLCQGGTAGQSGPNDKNKRSVGDPVGEFHLSVFQSMPILRAGEGGIRGSKPNRFLAVG